MTTSLLEGANGGAHLNGDAQAEDMNDREAGSGFSALAHHALAGDHVNGHDLHKLSSRHSGSGEEETERPKIERAPESQHISKQMPDSAFSRSKREEIERIQRKHEEGISSDDDESGMDDDRRRDIEKAGAKMRNAFGLQDSDAQERHEEAKKRQEEDEEKERLERKKARKVPQSLAEEKTQRDRGDSTHDVSPTSAEKGQAKYLEPNGQIRLQPSQSPSYEKEPPVDGERIDGRRKRKSEVGIVPDPLAPTKEMAKPGPRNEINLKPRLPHLHFHNADNSQITTKANDVPLDVSGDGERELLSNGNVFRMSNDPEDILSNTREQESARILDGDYTQEPFQSSETSLVEMESGDKVRGMNRRGDSSSTTVGISRGERIPKADHQRRSTEQDRMESANSSPTASRPRGKRMFSSFRNEDGSMPSPIAGGRPSGLRKETRFSISSAASVTMQGAMDNERQLQEQEQSTGQKKWNALRNKMLRNPTAGQIQHSTPAQIPVTTELLAGQLPVMILKTWLDRDEKGNRAVPILLGNLRFRVGDSAGFGKDREQQTGREVFRIECEYGDGVVKWVIYRELRDFISLHTHYKTDNLENRVTHLRGGRHVDIPEFPRALVPYLNRLRRSDAKLFEDETEDEQQQSSSDAERPRSKQERSRLARQALQTYLVDLIRAVMFRPESARLCRFLELSCLTLTLAPRGGFQSKAGYLKIIGAKASKRANQPGMTPASWMQSRKPKWWIVRESYFVCAEGPETDEVYEVFLIDEAFVIERPKRALRLGLSKVTGKSSLKELAHMSGGHQEGGSATAQRDYQAAIAAQAGSGDPLKREQADPKKEAALNEGEGRDASQHTFYIQNTQQRLKLVAKNVRVMQQFIIAMERVASQSIWSGPNRFASFAPIRVNASAQWLVDGRDYFWNLSRALNMAKSSVYIHDWWLSPELYLRRPGNERYRLDNLLKRKAEEGVKVYIIIYNEVSDKTTPVDSVYTKKRLTGLHPNVMVQRSPSHLQTGTFFWSHHEKMCVIDETIAFMGGLDLCFGRWDTSQHIMVDDDSPPGSTGENGPIWPGKDLANDRVVDFNTLNKPFEDMFDRTKIPRMPWHDVGVQLVGQPARDLCRHFVQRWNFLMRTKNHKRVMPLLLPPADYTEFELQKLGIQGTCEVQICRSCGPWSMGTEKKIEHSIQHAYLKAIQLSEHFVYIENQFFITSTVVDNVEIENRIGDALVDRIIRAHQSNTPWRACIVIPLLPGYALPIDTPAASSVRLILECQNRTISRGTHSIFSRLREKDIDPNEYITFFSLRGWGKFKSGALCTEQVYIHGKTMVVDDRLVICGSANINERSQRGDRDSELAAVIRDTDMIDSKMAGKPYKVGRFAHTLRMRLMREHAGVDVDAIEEDQLMDRPPIAPQDEIQKWDPDHEQAEGDHPTGVTKVKRRHPRDRAIMTAQSAISSVTKGLSENAISNVKRGANVIIKPLSLLKEQKNTALNSVRKKQDDDPERQDFDRDGEVTAGFASSVIPTLEEETILERRPSQKHVNGRPLFDAIDEGEADESEAQSVEEATVPNDVKPKDKPVPVDADQPGGGTASAAKIVPDDGESELYGAPANATDDDDEVPNKDTERDDGQATEMEKNAVKARQTLRKHLAANVGVSPWTMPTPTPKIDPDAFVDPLAEDFWKNMWLSTAVHNTEIYRKVFRCIPDDLVTTWASYKAFANHAEKFNKVPRDVAPAGHDEPAKVVHGGPGTHGAGGGGSGGGIVGQDGGSPDEVRHMESEIVDGHPSMGPRRVSGDGEHAGGKHRKPSAADEGWHDWERAEMEQLLQEVRGHLVIYPNRFLETEDEADNFLFNGDKILPLPIYN